MIEIIEKEKCTGCGTCLASCSKSAISMKFDEEGFAYPSIDQFKCIDCGVCKKICPPNNIKGHFDKLQNTNTIQKGFAARSRNFEERLISSSGSIFAVLSHQILEENGVVVGVTFDEQFNAEYKIVERQEDLPSILGSKYIQSKADSSIFHQVEIILKEERKVLFSGLACQIEGLQAFLRKEYTNLICVDLICMGIPSAEIWQKYLKAFFSDEIIQSVNFKEKSKGWNHFSLAISTDKRSFKQWGMINSYFKSMFNTYNMRKSCFVCPFKKIQRAADITLADCWGANQLAKEIDDNMGLSSVIVHSSKGLELWKSIIERIDYKEIPIPEIIKGNPNMVENRICDIPNRKHFYKLMNRGEASKAFDFAQRQEQKKKLYLSSIIKTNISHGIRFLIGDFNYRALLDIHKWVINKKMFNEYYSYDLKFNASFRDKAYLSADDFKLLQIKYLLYYRKAQAALGTIWQSFYMRRLIKFSQHTGIMLYENMNIPKGLIIGHPGTIIINDCATFDGNIMMTHGVTIGRDVRGKRVGAPHFGKNVCIRCNSTVVGGITIGDDVLIAPNTFVNFDVPSHSVVIGNPATIHHKENATEGHIGVIG